MAKGSELFSLITRLYTITFTMLSTFSRLGMISVKVWKTPLCWHTECSLPVAVRVSKTRMLKVPQTKSFIPPDLEDFKSENVGTFTFLTFFILSSVGDFNVCILGKNVHILVVLIFFGRIVSFFGDKPFFS